jgi:hypothetical protein
LGHHGTPTQSWWRSSSRRGYQINSSETPSSYEPDVTTRNRKPLKRPVFFEATWELRFGPGNRFRVFYDIDQKQHVVAILAIGIKRGNRLLIGGEEIRL